MQPLGKDVLAGSALAFNENGGGVVFYFFESTIDTDHWRVGVEDKRIRLIVTGEDYGSQKFFLKRALPNQLMSIAPLTRSPQALQIVEFARSRRENMNDEIDVVQKDPLAFSVSLDVQRPYGLSLQCLFNIISDGLIVTCRGSSTNQEIIGEGANIAKFDHHRVLRVLIECCFDGFR